MADPAVADYEATISTGLEFIAKEELLEKFGVDGRTEQGRIWFSTDAPVQELLKLRSICNLFVIIYDKILGDSELPDSSSLEPFLMDVGERCNWPVGLAKWKEMSKFSCPMEKLLTKSVELKSEQPKFRVSSNRNGPDHKFTSPEVCSMFGHVVDTKYGWPIKLKDYDLEIMVNINRNHLYVVLTLTPIALDRRNILVPGYTTLRAATCYAMLRMARIECGDIVMDPMTGSGAIPVECAFGFPDEWAAYSLAGELEISCMEKCRSNLGAFSGRCHSDLLQLDATYLPFREDSIDVFVSDLPFGKRHGSKKKNRKLYPAILREMGRIARMKSARAVLLTQDCMAMRMACDANDDLWTLKSHSPVKIGNLRCFIYSLQRNAEPHTDKDLSHCLG